MNLQRALVTILLLALASTFAGAAVTPEQAARLKTELTPLGAEKSGNKEGTIPAWDGGYTAVWPGYRSGQARPDPFAAEKPRLRITAQNMQQYAEQLSDGTKALLQQFPSFRIDVYPSHRTAAAPQWVYDNTFKNATRARLTSDAGNGPHVQGAYGGIPFPIPSLGAEAIWNHQLAWHGEAVLYNFGAWVVAANGRPVLATAGTQELQYPYYYQDGSLDGFAGVYWVGKLSIRDPPFRAGEKSVAAYPAGKSRQVWQYLTGQRRVRRTPNFDYDIPNFVTSGFNFVDETFLFIGALDRYHWKLLGKKEVLVPYNTQRFHTEKLEQVLGRRHLDPDALRWELHRVWVVEANLAPAKRHAIPKRRFYLDEDSWQILLSDGWNAAGQLWHVGQAMPVLAPELPGIPTYTYVMYDLLKGGYTVSNLLNEQQPQFRVVGRQPEANFSPGALVAEGVR